MSTAVENTKVREAAAVSQFPRPGSVTTFPSEAGRWYDKQGNPVNEVTAKNGNLRPTTIVDARKLNLVPSVTTVLRVAAKPGLDAWKLRQMFEVAYTTPRSLDESDDDFFNRVNLESKEKGRLASERGTSLHGAIEKFIQGQPVPTEWSPHVTTVRQTLSQYGIDLATGKAEKTFVSPLGYGGKLDWHDDKIIIDFKTKDRIEDKKKLAYPEHVYQLAAYMMGLNGDTETRVWKVDHQRLINVFVGAADGAVRIVEWSPTDAERGWRAFKCLFDFWRITNDL